MKKFLMLLAASLFVMLTACGTSTQDTTAGSTPEASMAESSVPTSGNELEDMSEQVDMLYYKKLGDESMMAACYTEEGIARLGQDYYVIHTGNALITNAAGEKISLDQLTRGCPVRISFPGMVMESYPAQISATAVQALSDEADPRVPPEDEIEPIEDGGPKWWVEEPVTEVPALELDYTTEDFGVHMRIEHRSGSWSYEADNGDGSFSGGAQNAMLDGAHPTDWLFDDNNTIKRAGFDRINLSTLPAASEMTVQAYTPGQPEAPGIDVPLDEEGTVELLDGSYIYVVSAVWAQGNATYGFLVTEESSQ